MTTPDPYDLSALFDTLAVKPPHPLDPYLNEIQRRAYSSADKDGIIARTAAALAEEARP